MENFVWLLQNFARSTAPSLPLAGQCWYDTTTNTLKVYNGTTWASNNGTIIKTTAPTTGSSLGELWYDSTNLQVRTWNGTSWDVLGPLGSASNTDPISPAIPSNSKIDSIRISDGSTNRQVWRITVGGTLIAIISKGASFSPSPAISGFATIYPGINFNSNQSGIGVAGDANAFTAIKTNLPATTGIYDLGSATKQFNNIYSEYGTFSTLINVPDINVSSTATFSAGTTTSAPIQLTSGSLLTTTTLGTIEYSSDRFYVTSNVNGVKTRFPLEPSNIFYDPVYANSTQDSISTTTGGIIVAGGIGVAGNITVGGNVNIIETTVSTSSSTGALKVSGGVGVQGNVYVGGRIYAQLGDGPTSPGYSWANNTDTGMYTAGTNIIGFGTDGTERVRINATGAIGIAGGNYGSAGDVLTSNGSSTSPAWQPVLPAGVIMPYAGSAIPTGWIECAGQSVLRATYADLFTAIGITYGSVDGTHFTLPDLRGYFVRGWDNGAGVDTGRAFGSTQQDDFKSHTHQMKVQASSGFPNARDGGGTANPTGGAQTYATGGTETRPKNVAMYYIIKI